MAQFTNSAQTERKGIHRLAAVCERMGYIWRETPNTDVGFDGEIEIVVGGQASGQIIKVQSRSGKSYIRNENSESFDFYSDANELEYWKGASNPVLLFLYDPEAERAYWMDVKKYIQSHAEILTSRPHKITFSKAKNAFNEDSTEELREMFAPSFDEFEDAYSRHVIDRFSKLTLYSVTSDAPIAVDLERIFVTLTATTQYINAKGSFFVGSGSSTDNMDVYSSLIDPFLEDFEVFDDESQPTYTIHVGSRASKLKYPILYTDGITTSFPEAGVIYQARHHSTTSFSKKLGKKLDISRVHKRLPHLIIVGVPGAGKTTLLKYLALTFARGLAPAKLGIDEVRLPIFIALRDFSRFLDSSAQHGHLLNLGPQLLPQFVSIYIKTVAPHLNIPIDFFEKKLADGQCIILLDGLDEVADPIKRGRVAEAIAIFSHTYKNNRIIITSRPRGYEGETKQRLFRLYSSYAIRNFDNEDIATFAESWYEAVTRDRLGDNDEAIAEAHRQSSDLVRAINADQRVKALAHNPLLLSVLAMVHQRGVGLPHRRAELYSECTDLLLGYWDQTKGGEAARDLATYGELDRTEKRALLEPIALWFHERGEAGLEADKNDLEKEIARQFSIVFGDNEPRAKRRAQLFLRVIDERAGLLVESDTGVYTFAHLTFQEYLAARAIADSEDYIKYTVQRLHDGWWREVILLEVGHLSDVRHFGRRARRLTSDLIRNIWDANSPLENILKRDLLFAARALADVGLLGVNDELRQAVFKSLLELWRKTNFESQLREIIDVFIYALPTIEGKRFREEIMSCINDETKELRVRGVKALGQIGSVTPTEHDLNQLLTLMNDIQPIIRSEAALAATKFGKLALNHGVLKRLFIMTLDDKEESVRIATSNSISQLGSYVSLEPFIKRLVKMSSAGTVERRCAATRALGYLVIVAPSQTIIDTLIILRADVDADVQDAARNSLTHMGILDTASTIQKLRMDQPRDALGGRFFNSRGISDEQPFTIKTFLRESADTNPEIRAQTIRRLLHGGTRFKPTVVVERLLVLTTDSEIIVRNEAAVALGRLSKYATNEEVKERLLTMLSDISISVAFRAAWALARILKLAPQGEQLEHLAEFWNKLISSTDRPLDGKVYNFAYEELRNLAPLLRS